MKSIILVPSDFTEVAQCALNHAALIAKSTDSEIVLLNVVSKDSEHDKALADLRAIAGATVQKEGIDVTAKVVKGSIFEDIGGIAKELKSRFIIMGTHGVKGVQRLVGSYAMKVITNSSIPFIIVQKKDPEREYKNLVLPINNAASTKQKLGEAAEIAKFFGATIHILGQKEADKWLANKVLRNLKFAKDFLYKEGVAFTSQLSPGKGGFSKEVVTFAKEVNADLISIVNTEGSNMANMFGPGYEQNLITNEPQIPVLCVHPIKTTTATRGASV